MDIQGKTPDCNGNPVVRWGPLLAYCYMHGCEFRFVKVGARSYVVPVVEDEVYKQIAVDVITAVRRRFPWLGLVPSVRPRRPAHRYQHRFICSC